MCIGNVCFPNAILSYYGAAVIDSHRFKSIPILSHVFVLGFLASVTVHHFQTSDIHKESQIRSLHAYFHCFTHIHSLSCVVDMLVPLFCSVELHKLHHLHFGVSL